MTHRYSFLQLKAHEAICKPTQECVVRARCARFKATPAKLHLVRDYSTGPKGGTVLCDGFFLLWHAMFREGRNMRRIDGLQDQRS